MGGAAASLAGFTIHEAFEFRHPWSLWILRIGIDQRDEWISRLTTRSMFSVNAGGLAFPNLNRKSRFNISTDVWFSDCRCHYGSSFGTGAKQHLPDASPCFCAHVVVVTHIHALVPPQDSPFSMIHVYLSQNGLLD